MVFLFVWLFVKTGSICGLGRPATGVPSSAHKFEFPSYKLG